MTGKASDSKYLLSQWIDQDDEKKDDLICIFDYTRSIENFVSYQGLEEIKNGIFMNTKYESKMVIINNPTVVVFANFLPEWEKLTGDRWRVMSLVDGAANFVVRCPLLSQGAEGDSQLLVDLVN